MAATLSTIVIDAHDVELLTRFWTEVLGWHAISSEEDGSVEIGSGDDGAVTILVEPAHDPKTAKNRLHLDLRPNGVDQAAELERLLALGATHVDIGQGEPTWFVLADPEGNEFCLLRGRADQPVITAPI